MTFQDKVAMITGGSEGIGKGIAQALAKGGAKIILVARTESKLQDTQRLIQEAGGQADYRTADIKDIKRMREIIDEQERLDIFINNAGAWAYHSIDSDPDDLDEFRKLIRAPERITDYLVHKFHKTPEKPIQILNVVSQAGQHYLQGNAAYGTGKMTLAIQLMNLQGELDHHNTQNIKLYGIYPATVATEKVMPDIRSGKLNDPTTLESVVNTTIELLSDSTPTRHAYVGYLNGTGIIRQYLSVNPQTFTMFPQVGENQVIDPNFNPQDLLKD